MRKWFFDDESVFNFPVIKTCCDLAADTYEEGSNIVVTMHVPGIEPHHFDIAIENDILRVSGCREEEEEEKKDYYRKEIRTGAFERSLQLPTAVIAEKASASYKDGVLTITVPKKTEKDAGRVKIPIK